ncbi:ribosomal protein S5 domain 2-type protein [Auriculariales sp. MPI-PUGE-AT-0066]|nr:ribosomal protein S5 domain 2-type protein [Auriculariales sp. MPI-PUGE-AT-0066]
MNVDDGDHAEELDAFVAALQNEAVADEIAALRSIYGDTCLRPYTSETARSGHFRYVIQTALAPPHDEVRIRILVSLPSSYPDEDRPQLQLLSRYIGAFGVTTDLFSIVLRTFMSSVTGVEWTPSVVCVFDGIEFVRERCGAWYDDRLSHETAAQLQREELHPRALDDKINASQGASSLQPTTGSGHIIPLPLDVKLYEAEAIIDRKSSFVGRACRISHPNQVPAVLEHLMSDRRVARAAHPIINAWRCSVNGIMQADNDDDGETAAGGRLAHLLQIMDLDCVLVIVTRYFGGIHLGPDRFKHINSAARSALEAGGFLDEQSKVKGRR